MNYIFTLPYDPSKYTVVENSLQIAFPLPSDVKAGQEITRTGKMDLDPGTVKSFHPASNKIKENQKNYILVNGSVSVTYEWTEEDEINESDVDAFIQYLNDSPDTWSYTKDMDNNKLVIEIDWIGENTKWNTFPLSYMLDCSNLSIVALNDEVEILCIMQKNSSNPWIMLHRDVPPGETVDVVKPECDVAYVITSQDSTIETTLLGTTNDGHTMPFNKYDVKKLDSDSVKLKNISDKPNKVLIYYK